MSMRPPTSTSHPSTGTAPLTARTATGQLTTGAVGVALNTEMKVDMRPVTREGMLAIGVGKQGPGRQVRDKTFWMGALRTRSKELEEEIKKLQLESNKLRRDSSQVETFANKLQVLQNEVQSLHDNFRDWNLAVEKLQEHSDDPIEYIERDVAQLNEKNAKRRDEADQILKLKIDKEEQISKVQDQINALRKQFEDKLTKNPRLQKEFYELQAEERKIDQELHQKQRELIQIQTAHSQIYGRLKHDPEKVNYLARLKEKKDIMQKSNNIKKQIHEIENEGTDEKENMKGIMKEVKEMQKERDAITQRIEGLSKIVSEREQKLDMFTGEKAQRHSELQKKEKQLVDLARKYPKEKQELTQKLLKHQEMVVELLDHISSNISSKENIPSVSKLSTMKKDLSIKQEEYERSKTTYERLVVMLEERKRELENMQNLDTKLDNDIKETSANILRMNNELKIYENINQLKGDYEELKEQMLQYKDDQEKLRDSMKRHVSVLSRMQTHTMKKIQNNPTYEALNELEKKIRVYEQNNHALKDYIVKQSAETDYSVVKRDSKNLIEELNKLTKKSLTAPMQ